jgi:hypothetical protein
MKKVHLGSKFDDFLKQESILDHCTKIAIHRINLWINERNLKIKHLSISPKSKKTRE